MSNLIQKVWAEIRPEYFFWAAVLCSFYAVLGAPSPKLSAVPTATAAAIVAQRENPFDSVSLSAKAAFVYDLKTKKELFAKNENDVLPLASITKIMTAVAALSFIPETTYITIDAEALRAEGDSGLKVGERWLLRDLLQFTLIESSNDGAVAVASAGGEMFATGTEGENQSRSLFVDEMNTMAESIGLRSTRFYNESGLDLDPRNAGAYSTAKETAYMLAYGLEKFPSIFSETRWSELILTGDTEKHEAKNTNKGTGHFPLLIASKTGYTDLAGGNLIIAFDAGFNHPIIVSVLGSTINGRFTDAEALVWATLDALSETN
ncbi:MAG: hypothetical protein AAB767_03095 [Patescibacteria group bacterium]